MFMLILYVIFILFIFMGLGDIIEDPAIIPFICNNLLVPTSVFGSVFNRWDLIVWVDRRSAYPNKHINFIKRLVIVKISCNFYIKIAQIVGILILERREEVKPWPLGEGFHGPIDPQEDKWIRWVAQHEFYACFCQTALTPNYSTHNCFFFFFFIDLDESSSFLFLWMESNKILYNEDTVAIFPSNLWKSKVFSFGQMRIKDLRSERERERELFKKLLKKRG
jgi:hypothetical protein